MAGSGKGVLRIAIEDFLTTTTVGKFFQDKIVKIGEAIEAAEAAYYGGFATAIRDTKGIPDNIKSMLPLNAGKGHQGGILSAMGFAGQLGGQAASALFAPYGKLLNYQIDQTAKSMRLDAGTAIAGNWRDPSMQEMYQGDLNDLGWTADRVKIVTKLMRPRLDPGQLMSLLLREKITAANFTDEMAARGYLPEDALNMLELIKIIPGVQDLVSMAVREAWNEDIVRRFEYDADLPAEAATWAAKQGLSADWFKRYWRAHWQLPSVTLGYEMLHRLRPGEVERPFTRDDMLTLLRTADYPTFFRDRIIDISYSPYTRVDVRRMHKLGVISDAELVSTYRDLGYDEAHAQKLADWTIKNETTTETTKVEVARSLNQGTIVDAYQKKVIDRSKAVELLTELKYDSQEIEIILKAAEFQKAVAAKTDIVKGYNDKMRTEIVSAYSAQMLSKSDATSMLTKLGYTSDEVTFVLQFADFDAQMSVLNDAIGEIGTAYVSGNYSQADAITALGKFNITGAQQTQLFTQWDTQRTVKSKRLTEAQYTTAWKRAIINDTEFKAALNDLGYSAKDIDLYIKIATPEAPAA